MTFNKSLRHINIALPEELLAMIDEECKATYSYRSDFIRRTLRAAVRHREEHPLHKSHIIPTDWLDTDDS